MFVGVFFRFSLRGSVLLHPLLLWNLALALRALPPFSCELWSMFLLQFRFTTFWMWKLFATAAYFVINCFLIVLCNCICLAGISPLVFVSVFSCRDCGYPMASLLRVDPEKQYFAVAPSQYFYMLTLKFPTRKPLQIDFGQCQNHMFA